MAKVTFVTFYLDYSIGVYVLSSILQDAGHEAAVLYFKLPSKKAISWFTPSPVNYEQVDMQADIIGFNADVNPWTEKETDLLIDKILEIAPDVLCISARSTDQHMLTDILPRIRARCDMVIMAGGFGPTLNPEFYLDLVDYVFVGEAENAISEIVSRIEAGQSIKSLDNLCYKENGKIIKNQLREPDISYFKYQTLPVATWYIDNDQIYSFENRAQVVPTHTYSTFYGRGCISSCSYCAAGRWYKIYAEQGMKVKKRRNRPMTDIIDELKSIKKKGYTFVLFRDEFLCARVDTLKRFFECYEREIGLPFWAYLVPDQILAHPELLEMAVDAGFVDTELGFQTGSDRINRTIFTRYISNSRTVEYAHLLAEYQINMKYDFIIFNPAETAADREATFSLLQRLPKQRAYIQMSRLHYFKDSPIVEILDRHIHEIKPYDQYYRTALLYLLCFVMPKTDFQKLLADRAATASWQALKDCYRNYVAAHQLSFPIGTHQVPDSITTHRYQRILKKQRYRKAIVWGNGDYYRSMSGIFKDVDVAHVAPAASPPDTNGNVSVDCLPEPAASLPIFICSEHKQEMLSKFYATFPDYTGKIYV